MIAKELFDQCLELAMAAPSSAANQRIHEVLVTACAEATRGTGQGFGNLFSQVDYLCKRHGIGMADRVAIQTMRRHSNHREPLGREDLLYDVRALCLLLSAVFGADVPSELVRVLPPTNRPNTGQPSAINHRYIRCIVRQWDDKTIVASTDEGDILVDYSHEEGGVSLGYLRQLLREGMQLNLLDCHTERSRDDAAHHGQWSIVNGQCTKVAPRLVVVEPDFLIDISALARCFNGYSHHPLAYTAERLKPRANTQAMLLGNFAGAALDDIINHEHFDLADTIRHSFKEQALQFCTCEGFNAQLFMADACQQAQNLQQVVDVLFGPDGGADHYRREDALLEPSFVCEQLGLQGRVDLMTTDMRLLVEQKSGKSRSESHYVQLLLYYGILRYNFARSTDKTDIRLLYSRYPAERGLLYVNFYQQLFREAIRLRNHIVATECFIAREGFGRVLPHLTPQVIFKDVKRDGFFHQYIEPDVTRLAEQLAQLSPLERAYYCRMLTFVYLEQLLQKVGTQEGQGGAVADLWNMPLSEKLETGNIFTDLTITNRQRSSDYNSIDLITLAIPEQGDTFLPNFRRGDMVYLYRHTAEGAPDVCHAILYKGTLQAIEPRRLVVQLSDGQQNESVFKEGLWVVEHASSDLNTTSNIKSLHQLATALPAKRQLLLGQRAPRRDTSRQLSRSYHPSYDDVLLCQKQACDYFLLVGPPGTGKTSMALRFMVEEELASPADLHPSPSVLLLSFTNRAVDEICAMLCDAGRSFIRLGHASSCDPRFRGQLLDAVLGDTPRLDDIRQRIEQTPIVVGTTSMLLSRPYIFTLKHFSLCVVDEASQILEPGLVGLLSSERIDRFVLIGDYKQLPAVVCQDETDSRVSDQLLLDIGLEDCRQSLFERLIRWEQRQGRTDFIGILRRQGRMHPDIARFPNRHFYTEERLEPVPLQHQLDTSLHYDLSSEDALDDVLKQQRVVFLPSEPCRSLGTSEKVNASEARIVADLLRRIHRFYGPRFDADKTVGVIVPYRNQIAMIRHELQRLDVPDLQRISIDTVERYQGSQRDVIVYSFTIQSRYQLQFLTQNSFTEGGHLIDRKLNVAITRARCQLLMTGNVGVLSENPLFQELMNDYHINNFIHT